MRVFSWLRLAALVAITVSCGSSSSDAVAPACTAGSTQACLGPGACAGAQSCKDDGSGWNACDCGGKTDSGTDPTDTSVLADSTTPGDTTTPDDTTSTDTTITDTPTDTGPITSLSPDKLSGLGLWLDSDKGVTLTTDSFLALKWSDQSPAGNSTRFYCGGGCSFGCMSGITCGLKRLIGDTKGSHDAYQILSSGTIGCCNFADSIIQVDDDPSIQFGKGPFAIFIVVKAIGVVAPIDLWGKQSGGPTGGLSIALDNTKLEVKTGTAAAKLTFSSSSGAYRLLVVRGPALSLRADGEVATGTTATDDLSAVGTPIGMGYVLGPGMRGEIDLAEYIAVKGAVSDAQVLGVEAYLKSKYKLTF